MGSPAGVLMQDGFSTQIAFASDANISLWEKTITPPGIDGGGEIDITTMLNTTYRTKAPKSLITLTEVALTAGYDAAVYDEVVAMMNINQLITITFPVGDTLAFYGWLNLFQPSDHVEGEFPEAECTIICSNQNAGVETAPVMTPI